MSVIQDPGVQGMAPVGDTVLLRRCGHSRYQTTGSLHRALSTVTDGKQRGWWTKRVEVDGDEWVVKHSDHEKIAFNLVTLLSCAPNLVQLHLRLSADDTPSFYRLAMYNRRPGAPVGSGFRGTTVWRMGWAIQSFRQLPMLCPKLENLNISLSPDDITLVKNIPITFPNVSTLMLEWDHDVRLPSTHGSFPILQHLSIQLLKPGDIDNVLCFISAHSGTLRSLEFPMSVYRARSAFLHLVLPLVPNLETLMVDSYETRVRGPVLQHCKLRQLGWWLRGFATLQCCRTCWHLTRTTKRSRAMERSQSGEDHPCGANTTHKRQADIGCVELLQDACKSPDSR